MSDDTLTYTFKLKSGATFQDGSPVEAKDVVYSVNRLLTLNEGPAYLFEGVLGPNSVKAIDSSFVEFKLSKVYTPFLTNTPILFVINSDVANANKTDSDPWAQDYIANNSIGAGAYKLDSWDKRRYYDNESLRRISFRPVDQPVLEVRFIVTNEEATVKALAAFRRAIHVK